MENLLIDLLIIALVFWAGVNWGKKITILRIARNIANDPDNLVNVIRQIKSSQLEELAQEDTEQKEPGDLIVERHENQIYLYDRKDNEFLAQGSTLEEALDRVAARYPSRKYVGHLTREEANALGIKP